jgi:hypothetical protein
MQKETQDLSYDELTPEAQAQAVMNYDPFVDWDWYSPHIEDFTSMMDEKYGIEVYDVEWGGDFGIWCQGRAWSCDVKKLLNAAVPELMAKVNSPFHRMEMGLDLDEDSFEDLSIFYSHSDNRRNPRAQAMEVELDGLPEDIDKSIVEEIEDGAYKLMFQELVALAVSLEKDWDWLHSSEAAVEDFRSNDTRFNPDGSLYE